MQADYLIPSMVSDDGEECTLIVGDAETDQVRDPLVELFSNHCEEMRGGCGIKTGADHTIFTNACNGELPSSKLYAEGGCSPIAARTWASSPSPACCLLASCHPTLVLWCCRVLQSCLCHSSTPVAASSRRHSTRTPRTPKSRHPTDPTPSPFDPDLAMSNRIVPAIYKQVIEDVISAVREDFEEYGVDDNLVGYLQQLWEASLVQTRVAKFVDGDDESEDEQPLRNGQSSTLPPTHQLLNLPRPGNPYTSEDVKPQIDANGNGTYNGGLRGGAGTMRLRGGAVSIRHVSKHFSNHC